MLLPDELSRIMGGMLPSLDGGRDMYLFNHQYQNSAASRPDPKALPTVSFFTAKPWVGEKQSGVTRFFPMGLFLLVLFGTVPAALAQVNYSVHFEMDKPKYLLGEPIFCTFVIRNTGNEVFAFRYRTPSRALAIDYDQEPRFRVTGEGGSRLADPAPRPCGNPKGTNVYGSVTLPPGQVHTERWLLNQWARFSATGRYHVQAERRLALFQPGPQPGELAAKPLAFALAVDEFDLAVERSTHAEVVAAFQPYLEAVKASGDPNPAEAVTVLTSLPQPFFLDELRAMLAAAKPGRWDRRDVLDGLARLNTPDSWGAILRIFRGVDAVTQGNIEVAGRTGTPLRAYALLLLAEKGDPAFVPVLVEMLDKSVEPTRGDILRALGFFHDARAYQLLFDNLHSPRATDRMNAILGLKNLGSREVIPPLLATLNDPEASVRGVANFALEGLTGHKVALSGNPLIEESQRAADNWHAWWREHAARVSLPRPVACHEW